MTPGVRRTLIRFSAAAGPGAALAYLAIGAPGLVLAVVGAGLWLVWRFDNWTGSCLVIAVLLLLVLAALAMLFALLAMQR